MAKQRNPVFIRHLAPRNFLSFGPDNAGIELKALNLFIGPNGSGKSNLIEAISLMRSAPKEMREVTLKGGALCFVSRRKQTCVTMSWQRTSPISACF